MEKCPRCGKWMLSYSHIPKPEVRCFNCSYEEKISEEEYRAVMDLLPKLTKSLELGKGKRK